MTEQKTTGNPLFDMWLDNQAQFLDAQSAWMEAARPSTSPFVDKGLLDRSLRSWQQCEDQYKHWMKAAENWIGADHADPDAGTEDHSAQALAYLLNPATFMQSGYEMLDKVFRKLVNGPEFADIGMLEKKMLKTGQEWQAFREAGHRYQDVMTDAWLRAYQHFADEFFERIKDENTDSEETLQRWLKIADEELTRTLRSEEFLDAQREFFATGTAYKLKYREFVEMWCESHTIPTRTEVDDLHKIIYELRREVRTLKRRLDKAEATGTPVPSGPKAKAPAKKKKPATKAPAGKKKATAKKSSPARKKA